MEVQDEAELCFPALRNTSCKKTSGVEVAVLDSVFSLIALLTVLLNLLVIISVSHFRQQLHTPTNLLLLSLAVSDFLVGLLLIPGEIARKGGCWALGDFTCHLYNFLSFIISSSSVGNMVLVSVDRYMAICDPLHYITRVTKRRVKVILCLLWLYYLSYNSILMNNYLTIQGQYISCYGECLLIIESSMVMLDIIVTFIVPVTIIVVLYTRVFVAAVSQARALRSHVGVKTKRSERKAARTIGILVLVFLVCFCPYYVLTIEGTSFLHTPAGTYSILVFYLNSCLNPLIYALFYPWFRKSVRLIITLRILAPGSRQTNVL